MSWRTAPKTKTTKIAGLAHPFPFSFEALRWQLAEIEKRLGIEGALADFPCGRLYRVNFATITRMLVLAAQLNNCSA